MLKKTNVCEICNKESLKTVLDLGRHPLCDDLIPIGNKKKINCTKLIFVSVIIALQPFKSLMLAK